MLAGFTLLSLGMPETAGLKLEEIEKIFSSGSAKKVIAHDFAVGSRSPRQERDDLANSDSGDREDVECGSVGFADIGMDG